MLGRVHAMRTRIITSPSFGGDRILGAILFEMTRDREVGGMGTAGLVPWFCGYHDGEKVIARGLAEHVRAGLRAGMPHLRELLERDDLYSPSIDPELLKRIYDDMVINSGAEVLFHSSLCAVELSGDGTPDALLIASKAGLTACRAKVYVDCTGDGDLAAFDGDAQAGALVAGRLGIELERHGAARARGEGHGRAGQVGHGRELVGVGALEAGPRALERDG